MIASQPEADKGGRYRAFNGIGGQRARPLGGGFLCRQCSQEVMDNKVVASVSSYPLGAGPGTETEAFPKKVVIKKRKKS